MLTIAMEEAIVAITASAMKHVSMQMEHTVRDAVGYAVASPSVTEAEYLHIHQGFGYGGGYAAGGGYSAGGGYAAGGGYSAGGGYAAGGYAGGAGGYAGGGYAGGVTGSNGTLHGASSGYFAQGKEVSASQSVSRSESYASQSSSQSSSAASATTASATTASAKVAAAETKLVAAQT